MPQGQRLTHRKIADGAPVIIVEVRATDPAVSHGHPYLVGVQRSLGQRFDP
jgi:hypothetical protein